MTLNSTFLNTSQSSELPLFAEDIARLVIIIIPSLLLSSLLLYHLCGLTKRSGIKPLLFLYVCVCILCIVGPTGYGVVSLVYDLRFHFADECIKLTDITYFVGHTMLSFTIGMVAVLQFMTVDGVTWKGTVILTVKNVAIAYLALLAAVLCINVIFLYTTCVRLGEYFLTAKAVWVIVVFVLSLIPTVVFPILTYLKVKRGILEESNRRILRSIALVSIFNVLQYAVLRLIGIVLYALSNTFYREDKVTQWYFMVAASLIADLMYPITVFSIFVVHSNLRRTMCCTE